MRLRILVAAGAAAASAAVLLAGPARAITPVVPISVGPGADQQVERAATTIDSLLAQAGIAPQDAGSGVKVGVIDSGIAVYPKGWHARTNACFTDDDYPQTAQLGDTRFTNNKVIVARVFGPGAAGASAAPSGAPSFGVPTPEAAAPHGSHVAGTIGCNSGTTAYVSGSPVGSISGIAPRVQLGSYNVFPGSAELGADPAYLADALDAAVADGMQIVNLSLGGPITAADPKVHRAIRRAQAAGVLVVVAAGNEGPKAGTVGSPGIFQESLTVGSVNGGRALESRVSVDGRTYVGPVGGIGIPVRPVSAPLAVATGRDGQMSKACTARQVTSSVSGKVAIVARGTCTFFTKLSTLQSLGAVGVVVVSEQGNPVAAMSGTEDAVLNLAAVMVSHDDGLALAAQAGKVASFGTPVLSVAGHVNEVSSFSSSGPADGSLLVKPDLVAPGADILSAAADPRVQASCGVAGTCFQIMSGTSMAAPYVTGVAAVLRQIHPDWSVAMLRSALAHTANPDAVTGSAAANRFRAGGGLVDPVAASNAAFGIAQTSVLLRRTAQVTVLNPSDVPMTVVMSSSTSRVRVSASTVTVPAHGSADVVLSTAKSVPGSIAVLTVTNGVTTLRMNVRIAPK